MSSRGRSSIRAGDRAVSLVVMFAFSIGLGVATVTIPLLALDAGYDPAAVGFLVAISAGSQFTARLALPVLLGRYPDRALIAGASFGMAAAFVLLIASTALPAFVLAQLLQGVGRALFWTASQTHAVRGDGRPLERLVDMNVAGNAGTLIGPALGGTLALLGLPVALVAAAMGTAVAGAGALLLRRLPPYDRARGAGTLRLIRRDGVDVACWAAAVGGGWWAMLGSYLPVLGVGLGLGSAGIGWLITLSEGSGMIAILVIRRLSPGRIGPVVRAAAFITAATLVTVGLVAAVGVPAVTVAFAVLMMIGGASSGTITTLAPAMASLAAEPEEQGDALALTGMFRAGALLGAPAAAGALLAIVGVPGAVATVAVGLGLPGTILGRHRPGSPPRAGEGQVR